MNLNIPHQEIVINFYGKTAQIIIIMEELSELIQAVSKMHRFDKGKQFDADAGYDLYCNLVEEMADVLIVLRQIQTIYHISDTELQEYIDKKIKRQKARMEDIHEGNKKRRAGGSVQN